MLLLGIIGIAGMSVSGWMAQSISGQCPCDKYVWISAYAELSPVIDGTVK